MTEPPMEMMPLKPERKAQLEECAKRRGQDPVLALDETLATYLDWERQDFAEAAEGIRSGYDDVKAGHIRPAAAFLTICAGSMTFRVEVTAQADHDADVILEWSDSLTSTTEHPHPQLR
jgi:predicted transcriptional regulator